MLVFTKLPKRGDIVIGNKNTREVLFLKRESFESTSELDLNTYEINGFVVKREGKKVLIGYKNNSSKKWSDRWYMKLTGYTLDGTARTGTLKVRTAADWGANVDCVIPYNASTVEDMIEQLNTHFAANEPFIAQDWMAESDGNGGINLHCNFVDYRQASNSGTSGFGLSSNLLPNVEAYANIRRKHGGNGGEGVISSWYRAITYFRGDNSSTTYNPNNNVTSIKTGYPVCLPAYLGTSQYRVVEGVQMDYCSLLRSTYGEGEAGWLKYMESMMPVRPTDFGNMGMKDGLARTKVLAEARYSSLTKSERALCPAADYCYSIGTVTIPQGNWFLGTTDDIAELLKDVKYPSHGGQSDDPINDAIKKIGGSSISNSSSFWSCCRCYSGNAWIAYGSNGFFNSYGNMCNSNVCVPFTLYTLD